MSSPYSYTKKTTEMNPDTNDVANEYNKTYVVKDLPLKKGGKVVGRMYADEAIYRKMPKKK